MINLPNSMRWTTQDELAYLRGLYLRGKILVLRSYVQTAVRRQWWGDGMNVDPQLVILAARDWLAELEGKDLDSHRH
jgi:hypothetical protein